MAQQLNLPTEVKEFDFHLLQRNTIWKEWPTGDPQTQFDIIWGHLQLRFFKNQLNCNNSLSQDTSKNATTEHSNMLLQLTDTEINILFPQSHLPKHNEDLNKNAGPSVPSFLIITTCPNCAAISAKANKHRIYNHSHNIILYNLITTNNCVHNCRWTLTTAFSLATAWAMIFQVSSSQMQ